MQSSMVLLTLSVLDRKHPFRENLVQKIKIVSLTLLRIGGGGGGVGGVTPPPPLSDFF